MIQVYEVVHGIIHIGPDLFFVILTTIQEVILSLVNLLSHGVAKFETVVEL